MARMAKRLTIGVGIAVAAAALAVGAALAHGPGTGYGPGHGYGAGLGMGFGPGMVMGGPVGGFCGGAGRSSLLLSQEELAAHTAKMQSLASHDECKAYMADFSKQLQARAQEKGTTAWGPSVVICDRMKAHGYFQQ